MKSMASPKYILLSLSMLLLTGSAFGATIAVTDPARISGANAISPSDAALSTSFNATNSTAVGTITALDTFGAVQDFSGFTGNATINNDYIFSFTDPMLPDVRFRYTSSVPGGNSVALSNNSFSTSSSSAMRLLSTSTTSFTMRIDFGSYNAVNDTFTIGAEIEAAAFTIAGRFKNTLSGITIQYLDASANSLSSQLLNNQTHGGAVVAGYTGFATTGNGISAIEIAFAGDPLDGTAPLFGLDDFGFTAIPEPSTAVLILGAFALGALRRRRR